MGRRSANASEGSVMANKKQKKKANKNNNNTLDTTNNTSSSVAKTTETAQQAAPPALSQLSKNDDKQAKPQQKGFKGQAKKDMQAVEGYVAEGAEGEGIDESKLDKAWNIVETVNEEKKRLNDQKLQKQKDAEKIKVSKEDIEFIMREMDVPKPEADKYLKENQGDLVEALKAMVNAYS
ncbi:19816_t:CDS:2 [Rhizophagus irregularis]|nr:19816_t:CDS:2 [Rhizophagus irregularis]